MKSYVYLGSTKENHSLIVSIGRSVGLQHCRKMSIGDKIASLASSGHSVFVRVCEDNPEFFSSI